MGKRGRRREREELLLPTSQTILALAEVADRLGPDASSEEITAAAIAQDDRLTPEHEEVLQYLMVEWLEALGDPSQHPRPELRTTRGEHLRTMVRLREEGLLDGRFEPTVELMEELVEAGLASRVEDLDAPREPGAVYVDVPPPW